MHDATPYRYFIILALAGMVSAMVIGCAGSIAGDDLLTQMQTRRALLVVDVRSRTEYDRDHLPGAVHIPFYSIASGIAALGFPKNDPVVIYCEHGPRAGIAGVSLFLSGYNNVFSLKGHMKAWRKKEFPIEVITH
jgi:rhodanese-related sulfurtransferase